MRQGDRQSAGRRDNWRHGDTETWRPEKGRREMGHREMGYIETGRWETREWLGISYTFLSPTASNFLKIRDTASCFNDVVTC